MSRVSPRLVILFLLLLSGCTRQETPYSPAEQWTRDGAAVSSDVISSHNGDRQCDWEAARFLRLSFPVYSAPTGQSKVAQYVRDPEGVLDRADLRDAFQSAATLPSDARSTGYRRDDTELWLADSDRHRVAYLVRQGPRQVEAWPRVDPPMGCD
ncbi:hypothetical protein SAMN05421812_105147 [Asanoa hainanensis]|uniref:Lipoprotein n=1 Tax=Asanoa hainanensis TaxID=560556 RepID=A0A239M7P8_9ACTN|nr:hypothetical protein [Asanoa hainanensis]SNT37869.1 hypothetical protein SAMN05421812_105147 [Asanoa hainanensis]